MVQLFLQLWECGNPAHRNVTAIHQFLPSYAPRDAIGSHTTQVQRALQDMGIESNIYSMDIHATHKSKAHHYREYRSGKGAWMLYQASTGSKLGEWLLQQRDPMILDYHNITPPEFFDGWEGAVAAELKRGRRQLKAFKSRVDNAIADSAYNEAELKQLGYSKTAVVPILLDTTSFDRAIDLVTADRLAANKAGGGIDMLFVGRLAPNKCQHDLIKLLAAYRSAFDDNARLHLVGPSSSHAYEQTLLRFADGLGLRDAVNFAGSVTDTELAAYYQQADVFVSASEHEGFCVPLLESMYHELPIVAYGAAAVPETLGDAGLCIMLKDPLTFASAVHRVVSDAKLQNELRTRMGDRLSEYSLEHSRQKLMTAVESIVGVSV